MQHDKLNYHTVLKFWWDHGGVHGLEEFSLRHTSHIWRSYDIFERSEFLPQELDLSTLLLKVLP